LANDDHSVSVDDNVWICEVQLVFIMECHEALKMFFKTGT